MTHITTKVMTIMIIKLIINHLDQSLNKSSDSHESVLPERNQLLN